MSHAKHLDGLYFLPERVSNLNTRHYCYLSGDSIIWFGDGESLNLRGSRFSHPNRHLLKLVGKETVTFTCPKEYF